jgi:hypothetical protein
MGYEERARKVATDNGWFINGQGRFCCNLGAGQEETLNIISPDTPGAWGMLCVIDGLEVPVIENENSASYIDNPTLTLFR